MERLKELIDRACDTSGPIAETLSASEWHELRDELEEFRSARHAPGAEAEDFRRELEALMGQNYEPQASDIQGVLDRVDARDSLAYLRDSKATDEMSASEAVYKRQRDEGISDAAEKCYWDFDRNRRARRDHGGWMEECDAFKAAVRVMLKGLLA